MWLEAAGGDSEWRNPWSVNAGGAARIAEMEVECSRRPRRDNKSAPSVGCKDGVSISTEAALSVNTSQFS